MKTRLLFFSILLLFFLRPFSVVAQTVGIDSTEACAGDTILMPVMVTGFTGVAAVSLIIDYNPAVLTFDGITNVHPQVAGMMGNAVTTPKDEIRLGWFSMGAGGADIGTGKLLDLVLIYHGGTQNLVFDPNSELADNTYMPMNTTYFNGYLQAGESPQIITQPVSVYQCNGNSAAFIMETGNTLNIQWEVNTGSGWTPVANAGIYSGANTDTLSISSVDASMDQYLFRAHLANLCHLNTNVVTLNVSTPSVDAGADDTICFGNQTSLHALAAGGFSPYLYDWQGIAQTPSVNVSPTQTTTYTINLTDSLGCTAQDQITVYVSNPLVDAGNSDTICSGAQTTLSAQVAGGYTPYSYNWQHGGTQPQTTVSPTAGTFYHISVIDKIGCVTTDSVYVEVSSPAIFVGNDDTICHGSSITIGGFPNGGFGPYSFLWNNMDNSPQITITPASSVYYSLTVTDKFGCTATDDINITVSNPVTNIGIDDTLCLGQNRNLSANTSGGFAPYAYQWSTTETSLTINVSPSASTVYDVTVTDANGCVSSDQINIFVSNPQVDAGVNDTICYGNQAILTATGSNGYSPYSFTWTGIGSGSSVQISPTITAWHSVTMTDAANCSVVDSVLIYVSHPVVTVGDDDTICLGDQLTINANLTGGLAPVGYLWNDLSTQTSLTITPSSTGTYSVSVTDNIGCQSSASKTVYVSNPVIDAGSSDTICYGNQTTLSTQTTGGFMPYTYNWQHGGNQDISVVSPLSGSVYYVTVTDIAGCYATDSVFVEVSNPVVMLGGDDTICIGAVTTLSGALAGGYGPFTYLWSDMNTTPQITVSPASTTNYSLTVTDRFNCITTDDKNVLVSNPLTNLGSDDTLCSGQNRDITAATTGGIMPYSYNWSTSATGLTINVSPSVYTNYQVTVTDAIGCISVDTIGIYVSNPVVNSGINDSICFGDQSILTATGNGGYLPYSFNWGAAGSGSQIVASPGTTTWFQVTLTDAANCQSTDSVMIYVSHPTVSTGPDDTICIGTQHTITAGTSGGTGLIQYLWSDASVLSSINVSPTQTTSWSVTITDQLNCQATDTFTLTVSNPVADAGNDIVVCEGATVSFTGSATGGITPYQYSWNGTPGQQINLTANTSQPFLLLVTDAFGCTTTDTAELIVNPNPIISVSPDDTICFGATAPLSASTTGGTGSVNYLWSTNATTPAISPVIISDTIFWVIVTDINNCTDSNSVTILVSDPSIYIGPDDTLCRNDIAALSGQIAGGFSPFVYAWSNGASAPQTNITALNDTCVSVLITDLIGCVAADTICFVVSQLTVDAGQDVSQCPHDALNLNAVAAGGIGTVGFLWSTGSTVASTLAYPFTDSIFVVTVNDQAGCSAADSLEVTMHPVPLPNLGPDDTICINHIKTLDPGAGFTTYLWSTGDNTQTIVLDGAVLGTGTFDYSVTVTNQFSCSNADTITIVVDPCIGIYDEKPERTVSIIPNPANDHFNLSFNFPGAVILRIYDNAGKLVDETELYSDGTESHRISTAHLRAGLYQVSIITTGEVISKKLILRK